MNCTNQNAALIDNQNEISPLKARLNRMAIHVPGNFPTPAEVIPIIEGRLAAHLKHISRTASSTSGDYVEWKQIHDAYAEFLTDLRAAQAANPITPIPLITPIPSPLVGSLLKNKIFPAEPGKIPQTSPPQQTHARNEPGMNPEKAGMQSEQTGISRKQTGKFPDQAGNSDRQAPPSATEPPQDTTSSDAPDDPDAPPKIQSNDEEFVAAATDLHYQRKGRSPFDKLSAADQAIVIDLFDKFTWRTVLAVIAQPSPLGFGLKVSKTALYDFHKRYEKRRRQQNVQASIDLLNKSSDPTQAFAQIFERLVQTRALTVASDPQVSLNIIDAVITSVNKLRKQTLAERKQLHAETTKMNASKNPYFPKNDP